MASRSSFWIFPSVRRQRSFVSSRISSALAFGSACSRTSRRRPLPRSRAFSSCFASMPSTSCLVVLVDLRLLDEQAVEHAVDVLRDRALLGAGRLGQVLVEALQRLADLDRDVRDGLQLLGRQPAVVADRGGADELADLLRVLGRDLVGDVEEQLGDELARLLERRNGLLLGPVGQAADPELVVLVEVPLGALREVVPAPLQPVLERGESLVAVDVDLLLLGLDLALEVVQVLLALGHVDRRHDRSGEVEDLLELARGDVEQVADPAGNALEEPDVRDGRGQVDVAHALAAHLLAGHLDAAALADDALVADSLVLAAVALPVLRRTEDALAEETVALGLERAVVDRLGLRDLAGRPVANLLRRRETDSDRVEIVDVDQVLPQLSSVVSAVASSGTSTSARSVERLVGREHQLTVLVDALLSLLGLLRRPAHAPLRGAIPATGRSRAPRPPAGARRPPRAPRPRRPPPR